MADAQDNVDGSGSLLLYASGLTITSASGSESVTTGSDTFAINPHSAETIAWLRRGRYDRSDGFAVRPLRFELFRRPWERMDDYLVAFDEGTSSYSLQFNQSTPVTLTEFVQ